MGKAKGNKRFDSHAIIIGGLILISGAVSIIAKYYQDTLGITIGLSILIPASIAFVSRILTLFKELKEEVAKSNESLISKIQSLENLHKSDIRADVIRNVQQSHLWLKVRDEFYFYNALWTLPDQDFQDDFKYLLLQKNTKWRVLYFNGEDENSTKKEIAERRKRNMSNAITKLVSKNKSAFKSIDIREAKHGLLPAITFFLFKDENGFPVSRIYIDKLLNTKSDKPQIAFDIYDDVIYRQLKDVFDEDFTDGKRKTLDDLLNNLT